MKAQIGTVINSTMVNRDLIPAFASKLKSLDEEGQYSELVREAESLDDYDNDAACSVLEDLFEALQDFAPEGAYFGAHMGDGADFGFWEPENHGEEA